MNKHDFHAFYKKDPSKLNQDEASYLIMDARQAAASIRQRYSSKGPHFIKAIIVALEETMPKEASKQDNSLFGDDDA